jgi:DNA-nicking Smr family endonuclease
VPRDHDDHEQPDDDDAAERAFRRAMADVVPLKADAKRHVPAARPHAPKRHHDAAPPPADDDPHDYVAPGIDRRELRRMRRGDYPVEDRLDLHGATVREVEHAVHRFIQNCRHAQKRCVCIVHGKGLHSAIGGSALRGPVRDALRKTSAVLAFASAPTNDGGTGAVYVLLRRK